MMENLAPLAAAVVIVLAGLALLASLVVIAVRALRRHDAEAADKKLSFIARSTSGSTRCRIISTSP